MATKNVYEEYTRAWWVTTISDIAAPTVAEIGAGTEITSWLMKDGIDTGVSTAAVDAGGLATRNVAQEPGGTSANPVLKMFRLSPVADDDAYDLAVWGTEGHLVIRRMLAVATAVAANQKVEVFKGKFGDPITAASAANQMQHFSVGVFCSDWNLRSTVAA